MEKKIKDILEFSEKVLNANSFANYEVDPKNPCGSAIIFFHSSFWKDRSKESFIRKYTYRISCSDLKQVIEEEGIEVFLTSLIWKCEGELINKSELKQRIREMANKEIYD